jgi:hypothetical protein
MTAPPDDAALEELVDLGFEFLCSRRVPEFVDVDKLVEAVDATATEPALARLHARHVVPLREALLDRAAASSVLIGAWLPEAARDKLAEIMARPMPIPKQWIDEAVASEGVRDQIREMLRETLTGFVSKVTSGGGGGAGGIKGAIGFGARAFGAAGKSLLGGLGEEIQKQMQERVRDFVDGAVGGVQERIARRLADPKTAEALGARRKVAFLKLLGQTEAQAAKAIRSVEHGEIDPLIASIVRHNLSRAEVRDAIRTEVARIVADLGTQTIGELLDEIGARSLVHAHLRAHGLPLARAFVATAGFRSWWSARV